MIQPDWTVPSCPIDSFPMTVRYHAETRTNRKFFEALSEMMVGHVSNIDGCAAIVWECPECGIWTFWMYNVGDLYWDAYQKLLNSPRPGKFGVALQAAREQIERSK